MQPLKIGPVKPIIATAVKEIKPAPPITEGSPRFIENAYKPPGIEKFGYNPFPKHYPESPPSPHS